MDYIQQYLDGNVKITLDRNKNELPLIITFVCKFNLLINKMKRFRIRTGSTKFKNLKQPNRKQLKKIQSLKELSKKVHK